MQEKNIGEDSLKRKIINNIKIVLITLLVVVLIIKTLVFLGEEKNLYIPNSIITLTPQNIGIKYEDLYFKTKDGQSLNGWFIPAKDARITILYFSGREGNLSDILPQVIFFNAMGVNVFDFDYRGFGNSSGKPNEKGLYEDGRAAYDYLMTRKDINKDKIIVYGKSLGGPVAADLCLNRKLAALILEGAFPSLRTYVGDMGGFLPTEWLVSEKFDTLTKVKNIHIPKLIVHGMDDDVIPFPEGRLIFNKAALPKEFLPYDGGHDDEVFVTSDDYKNRLNKFFLDNNLEVPIPQGSGFKA